jgi:hypothetical protein
MYIIPMEAPPSITVPTIASPISPVWSTCSNIVVTLPAKLSAKLSGTSHDQLPTIPDYETIMHPISTEKVEFLKRKQFKHTGTRAATSTASPTILNMGAL